ncbi:MULTISPECIES: hypothetical protein [unclassified Citromicrobium]|uniref:hypothetical protein n=1 Tax=unclassified Citromicrobium TaxID=2630544 RepID=UPI0012E11789|nr:MULTISPECIES: hypothetical protein [unclassified Citromicrobium]
MAVGRSHDRRFKIDLQIVPQFCRAEGSSRGECRALEEFGEAIGFGRGKETEQAAFVLAETPPGDRPKQRCRRRVERPAIAEPFRKVFGHTRSPFGNFARNNGSNRMRLRVRTLCRDSTTDEFDDLVDRRYDRDIREAALNLAPFVLDALSEAIRIALESLVQHAHDDKSSLAAIGGLCEILKEMDVDGVIGSTFQIFAQFIDNDENPALGTRFNLALQPLDDIAPVSGFHLGPLGPRVARLASDC